MSGEHGAWRSLGCTIEVRVESTSKNGLPRIESPRLRKCTHMRAILLARDKFRREVLRPSKKIGLGLPLGYSNAGTPRMVRWDPGLANTTLSHAMSSVMLQERWGEWGVRLNFLIGRCLVPSTTKGISGVLAMSVRRWDLCKRRCYRGQDTKHGNL